MGLNALREGYPTERRVWLQISNYIYIYNIYIYIFKFKKISSIRKGKVIVVHNITKYITKYIVHNITKL